MGCAHFAFCPVCDAPEEQRFYCTHCDREVAEDVSVCEICEAADRVVLPALAIAQRLAGRAREIAYPMPHVVAGGEWSPERETVRPGRAA